MVSQRMVREVAGVDSYSFALSVCNTLCVVNPIGNGIVVSSDSVQIFPVLPTNSANRCLLERALE